MKPGRQNVALEELQEWAENPRTISAEDFEQLKSSLLADPELLDARPLIALPDGTVIAGNMRLRALRDLGQEETIVHVIDAEQQRAREIAMRDNNQFGEWSTDALAAMIAELSEEGTNPLSLGFDLAYLDAMINAVDDWQEEDQGDFSDAKSKACPECGAGLVCLECGYGRADA